MRGSLLAVDVGELMSCLSGRTETLGLGESLGIGG